MTDSFDSQMDDEDFDAQFEQNSDEDQEPEDNFEEEEEQTEEPVEESQEVEQETEEPEETEEESDEEFDKPVSEGEVVELDIEDLGSKGDGIARVEGFVVFVPGGEVGKSYDVEITSVGRKFAFGEIEEEV